jgi:hypothetical protein
MQNTTESLILPLASLSKAEIDERVADWLNTALELHSPDELFVFLKQYEEAINNAIEKTKEIAFIKMANRFKGETKGFVLGHEVKLSYPVTWIYSAAVAELKEKQKAELKSLELKEQANGTAIRETQPGRITVTLRKEGK